MAAKVTFTEATENEWPICPSCKKELRGAQIQEARLADKHYSVLVSALSLFAEHVHHL